MVTREIQPDLHLAGNDHMIGSTDGKSRPRIGLALGGGGAKGLAHIGVLKVLEEAHFPIDFLAGTSVGALIGGAYASGMSIDRIIQLALKIRWRDLGRFAFSRLGYRDSESIELFVRQHFPVTTFEEARVPFAVVAADITTGEIVVLRSGDLARAIRASCAIPGYFTPVVDQGGRMLVDGGIVANLPTSVVRDMGGEKIIGVDVYPFAVLDRPPRNAYQVYIQSIAIVANKSCHTLREGADILVIPGVHGIDWDQLRLAPELIKAGEQAMLRRLGDCQGWLQERRTGFLHRLLVGDNHAK